MGARDLANLLMHCASREASDITIQTGRPVTFQRFGAFHQATKRRVSHSESIELLSALFKSESGAVQVNAMQPLNFAFEIKRSRTEQARFRVNAASCAIEGGAGLHMTLRPMAATPPFAHALGIEPELLEGFMAAKGLCAIAGSTGSGKTTLIAATIRHLLERPGAQCKFLTVEDPIEFVFDSVGTPASFAIQSEIGKHCPSYHEGVHNSLRQGASAMLIGETRSAETLDACVWAATSGKPTYTTLHSVGVPATLRRMVAFYPQASQATKSVEIIEALSLVCSQKLVPSLDGRRIALREFLILNDGIRDELMGCLSSEISIKSKRILLAQGQSFYASAQAAFEQGLISKDTLHSATS